MLSGMAQMAAACAALRRHLARCIVGCGVWLLVAAVGHAAVGHRGRREALLGDSLCVLLGLGTLAALVCPTRRAFAVAAGAAAWLPVLVLVDAADGGTIDAYWSELCAARDAGAALAALAVTSFFDGQDAEDTARAWLGSEDLRALRIARW